LGEDPEDKTDWVIEGNLSSVVTPLFANVVEPEVAMGVDGGGDGVGLPLLEKLQESQSQSVLVKEGV
jgi:hypothetical protein